MLHTLLIEGTLFIYGALALLTLIFIFIYIQTMDELVRSGDRDLVLKYFIMATFSPLVSTHWIQDEMVSLPIFPAVGQWYKTS